MELKYREKGEWRKREYESVERGGVLHLNKTVEQDFPRLQMSHECRRDGNKYLQNVSFTGEQQFKFLVLQSRFNLECFIYFTPEKKERRKKKRNRAKADCTSLSIATM